MDNEPSTRLIITISLCGLALIIVVVSMIAAWPLMHLIGSVLLWILVAGFGGTIILGFALGVIYIKTKARIPHIDPERVVYIDNDQMYVHELKSSQILASSPAAAAFLASKKVIPPPAPANPPIPSVVHPNTPIPQQVRGSIQKKPSP